jgi:hypothetical protein
MHAIAAIAIKAGNRTPGAVSPTEWTITADAFVVFDDADGRVVCIVASPDNPAPMTNNPATTAPATMNKNTKLATLLITINTSQ